MSNQPAWFFFLDQLDLLERDYQALFEHATATAEERAIEEKILAAHVDAEKRMQDELEAILDDHHYDDECPLHAHDDLSVDELLRSSMGACPLSQRSYAFVHALGDWARAQTAAASCYEDVFRLRANGPVIAAKIALAQTEFMHRDRAALLIADKELAAAEHYLQEVLASIDSLGKGEVMTQAQMSYFAAEGEMILCALRSERERAKR